VEASQQWLCRPKPIGLRDEASSKVLDALKFGDEVVRESEEKRVHKVNVGENEGAYKSVTANHVQVPPNFADAPELIMGLTACLPYMSFHGEMTVKNHAKVSDRG